MNYIYDYIFLRKLFCVGYDWDSSICLLQELRWIKAKSTGVPVNSTLLI